MRLPQRTTELSAEELGRTRGGCTDRIHQDYGQNSPHSTTTLATSVRQFVAGCEVCHRMEVARHPRHGVNTDQPCEGVTMAFVTDLSESTASGYTDILIVVDRLTKMAIYLPYHKNVDSPELVRMFFEQVICKRADRTAESGNGAVPLGFCYVRAGQLARIITVSRICLRTTTRRT
jgi:hypothetical protein